MPDLELDSQGSIRHSLIIFTFLILQTIRELEERRSAGSALFSSLHGR